MYRSYQLSPDLPRSPKSPHISSLTEDAGACTNKGKSVIPRSVNNSREDSQAEGPSTVSASSATFEGDTLQRADQLCRGSEGRSGVIRDHCMPGDRKGIRSRA